MRSVCFSFIAKNEVNLIMLSAHFGLTYKCNMNCSHCFVNVDKCKEKDLKVKYKEIIDDLYDLGVYCIFYTYGEPLLSDLFDEVASYVKTKNMYQVLMTTGWFIESTDDIEKLSDLGIGRIAISLDSASAEFHDHNRNKPGSWRAAMKALKLVAESTINAGIANTITNENVGEMKDIFKIAQEMNLDFVSYLRLRKNGKIAHLDDENEYFNVIENTINQISKGKTDVSIFVHDLKLKPLINKLRDTILTQDEYDFYSDMISCHSNLTISIDPSGNVYTCNLINESIGNVYSDDLKTLIMSNQKTTCCQY